MKTVDEPRLRVPQRKLFVSMATETLGRVREGGFGLCDAAVLLRLQSTN